MREELQRVALLCGEDGVERLSRSTVMVVGIGGVGSYSAEALARSGIGSIILVDGDDVALSNLNRQIHAVYETVGKPKTKVMADRIQSYNRECHVITHQCFYNKDVNAQLFDSINVDFVIDAIDTITCKLDLIEACRERNIAMISSLGMANRLDPTQIEITDLSKTSYDPLAKVMRNLVKKRGIKGKVPVIFSKEHPMTQHIIIKEDGKTRKEKMPPASTCFVPSAAGLAAASYAVRYILNKE